MRTASASSTRTVAASRPREDATSTFERYLTLWVALCIVAGIALGHVMPGFFQAVAAAEVARVNQPVAVPIWLMVIPMRLTIDVASLHRVGRHRRGIALTQR